MKWSALVLVLACTTATAAPAVIPVPAPTSQQLDKLPPGVRCRIGSERFRSELSPFRVYFAGPSLLRFDKSPDWEDVSVDDGHVIATFQSLKELRGTSRNGAFAVSKADDELEVLDLTTHRVLAHGAKARDGDLAVADDASRFVTRAWKKTETANCITILDRKLAGADVCFAGDAGSDVSPPALSADGKRIAVFVGDGYAITEKQHHASGTVYVIDAATARTIVKVALPVQYAVVALSPHGDVVAVGERDRLHVFDATSGAERKSWSVGGWGWSELAFAPDGKRLYGNARLDSDDSVVSAWELASAELWEQRGLFDVGNLAIAGDGRRIAYLLGDGLRLVDAASGADLLAAGAWGMEGAAISEDGELIATLSLGYVTLWDAHTCAVVKAIAHRSAWAGYYGRVDFIAGSHDVLVLEGDSVLTRIRADGTKATAHLEHLSHNDAHAISRDGKTLVFGIQDDHDHAQLAVWDLDTMRERRRIAWPKHAMIETVSFVPDQRTLIATTPGSHDGGDMVDGPRTAVEIDFARGKLGATYTLPESAQGTRALVFGKGEMFALDRSTIRRATRKLDRPLEADPVFVSSDGRVAVLMGKWGDVVVWPLDQAAPSSRVITIAMPTISVSASLDGTVVSCRRHVACDVSP